MAMSMDFRRSTHYDCPGAYPFLDGKSEGGLGAGTPSDAKHGTSLAMKFATWVQADCTLDFTGLDRQPKGMLRFFPLFVGALLGSFFLGQTLLGDHHEGETHPIKALLVTGGCCHNYPAQTQALQEGLSPYAKIEWTMIHEGGNGTRGKIALYDKEDWAKQFDVVVHNECFADTKDEPYVQRITQAHQAGVPAVVIHCAMHTYRAAPFDDWRQFLGVTSRRHDHQDQYPVQVVAPNHPIMKGFPEDWTSPKDDSTSWKNFGLRPRR